MAERRMFAKTIIDSDAFIDMPITARLLYYDLAMRADDDGFVNSPKKIMAFVGAKNDDINLLIAKKFILAFENGIIVIKHWRIHNYIRKDTYKKTPYQDEFNQLFLDENNAYSLSKKSDCQRTVDEPSTQVRLGKDRLGKVSIDNSAPKVAKSLKHKYGEYNHVLLTDDELSKLKEKFNDYENKIKNLDEYIEMKGAKYKNHYLTILKWARNEKSDKKVIKVEYGKINKKQNSDNLLKALYGDK